MESELSPSVCWAGPQNLGSKPWDRWTLVKLHEEILFFVFYLTQKKKYLRWRHENRRKVINVEPACHLAITRATALKTRGKICILRWSEIENNDEKRKSIRSICVKKWFLVGYLLVLFWASYWWACMIASEIKAADTCRPPNQRPLSPWMAFLAFSIASNLT